MKEILAGEGFENVVCDLQLKCKKTYDGNEYGVWEISGKDLEKIINFPDNQWKSEWGWFRYANGCNVSHWPTWCFMVNGRYLIGFYNELDEYADHKRYHKYISLTEYLCEVIGASTPKNICALAVDLAKQNDMTMAELFSVYQPINRKGIEYE